GKLAASIRHGSHFRRVGARRGAGGSARASAGCAAASRQGGHGQGRPHHRDGRRVWLPNHFHLNSAVIPPTNSAQLDRVAELLRQEPALSLAVEGHTDAVGSAEYNIELSRRRA